jgi:purine-binding chemotaxis protein CheW
MPGADTAMPSEFLSFRLGGEEYGIDILRVQEIRSYEPPTRIANAAHFSSTTVGATTSGP